MKRLIIRLDGTRARTLKFTSDLFEHGIIWDKLPHGIYITSLYPQKGRFFDAVQTFFGEIDRLHLKFRYSAPQPIMELYLIKRGYVRYVDKPGTPFYTNTTIGKSCVLAPRTAEEIRTLRQLAECGGSGLCLSEELSRVHT